MEVDPEQQNDQPEQAIQGGPTLRIRERSLDVDPAHELKLRVMGSLMYTGRTRSKIRHTYLPQSQLIVLNLAPDVTNEDFKNLLSDFELMATIIHKDELGRPTGVGEIMLYEDAIAFEAMRQFEGYILKGRPMRIVLSTIFQRPPGKHSWARYDRPKYRRPSNETLDEEINDLAENVESSSLSKLENTND